ncbi:MAG: master DNA invertase Mpi family serine-type recombinase [Bacteroidales bacterium]|nr:master DNA invertase Mpi family serine-type recombinase [Candidatus Colicola equi]
MIYGYIRVSSDKQTVENQRFEIQNFCKANDMVVDGWIEETISGTKSYNKRLLGKLLRRTKKGDIIICSELSRLGRNLFMIMEILNICMQRGCLVWTIKDHYRLGETLEAKVLAFAFGLSAEIERTLISQRTREALARKKAEGMSLGRPRGTSLDVKHLPLYHHHNRIMKLCEQGYSMYQIARHLHVSRNTVKRYLERLREEELVTEI